MTTADNIHRYLDQSFEGVDMTPDAQDLKEELRGNLTARVAELETNGTDQKKAATTAIKELGDIREIIGSLGSDASPKNSAAAAIRLTELNRVKPDPGYVVRTVLLAILFAAALAIITLGTISGIQGTAQAWLVYSLPVESVLAGAFLGLIVGDALVRETSQHYPMPPRRAFGFAAAAFAGITGLSLIGSWFANPLLWLIVTGCILALGSLMGFIALGVTQTNRLKPWVKDLNKLYAIGDRFSEDPASAARFGLYTVVIWVVAIAVFIVLSITIGFTWSWLALVAALVIFFLVLARMLFPANAPAKK